MWTNSFSMKSKYSLLPARGIESFRANGYGYRPTFHAATSNFRTTNRLHHAPGNCYAAAAQPFRKLFNSSGSSANWASTILDLLTASANWFCSASAASSSRLFATATSSDGFQSATTARRFVATSDDRRESIQTEHDDSSKHRCSFVWWSQYPRPIQRPDTVYADTERNDLSSIYDGRLALFAVAGTIVCLRFYSAQTFIFWIYWAE